MPTLDPSHHYSIWPWPGEPHSAHPDAMPGTHYDVATGMLIYVPSHATEDWFATSPSEEIPIDNPVKAEEEMLAIDKDEIRKRLRRARRGYDLYRDKDADPSDCFDFPTYATLFHGVTKAQAKKYWTKGDI